MLDFYSMCGIAGILSNNPSLVSTTRLKAMTDAIAHRGPDGEGWWINANQSVGFGHRRLAIIDLSAAAAQPFHYLNRYSITYNGELYNYLELREQLQKKGFQFQTASDTEVILAAYACWNADCLQQFDGMFAFAIWDEQEQTLFAARDRFGEKPFYYSFDGEQFIFASEMKALWAAGIPKNINHTMLLNYLGLGWVKNPVDLSQTFYQNINCLSQSHFLTLSLKDGHNQITQYWDVDKETTNTIAASAAIEQLQDLLQTSVKRRLRSDVEIGSSLSGGLDSSSIVASIHQLLPNNKQFKTFTASFPGFEKDETLYAKQVADLFQLEQFIVCPTAEGLITNWQQLLFHQEEPFQSSSIYAQYKVYELAKQQQVKVILDGQGADESLAGYHQYLHWFLQEKATLGESVVLNQELKAFQQNQIPVDWSWKNKLAAKFPELTAVQLESKAAKQIKTAAGLDQQYVKAHFSKDTLFKPIVRKLNDLLYYNTMQFGLEELLRYADRNCMAHGREVRLPFLNHELVQFIFSLPSSLKIKDGFTKAILRASFKNSLPAAIVYRADKIGYEPPQQAWMQNPVLVELMQESRKKLVGEKILAAKVLQQPIEAKPAHAANNDDWRYFCAANLF